MEVETYEGFINNILNTRGRFACGDEYHERHHIIPKCIDGGNEEENLIDLFAREHFIAHKLLALENPDNYGLQCAYSMMAFPKNNFHKRYELTPEEYEEARILFSESIKGENNPLYGRRGKDSPRYGKCHTEETKAKLSELASAKTGDKNPNYGNHKLAGENNPNYGKHLSEETKEKIRRANTGRIPSEETIRKLKTAQSGENNGMYGKNHSEESKKKMSDAKKGENNYMYGKHHSEETKRKISESNKGKIMSEETRQKMSESKSGERHPRYGKHLSKEAKDKLRESNFKILCQYDLNMNFIRVWEYKNQAAQELGISSTSISHCCNGVYKTAGGYQWRYLYDQKKKDGSIIPGAISIGLISEDKALSMLEIKD